MLSDGQSGPRVCRGSTMIMHLFIAQSFFILLILGPIYTAGKLTNEKIFRNKRSVDVEYFDYSGIDECISSGNCVPICCPPGLYVSGTSCVENADTPASELEFPQIYNEDLSPVNSTGIDGDFNFTKLYAGPCETGSYGLNPELSVEDEFYLFKNGNIYLPNYLNGTLLHVDGYCFASVLDEDQTSYTVIAVCFPDYSKNTDSIPIVYPILMLLSTLFLIATFAVYVLIPEFDNIHGLTLRAYVGVLFVAYIALVIVQLGDQSIIEYVFFCTALGAKKFENGSLYFKDQLFPPEFFWTNDTNIYGCPCELGGKPCIRTCCSPGEEFNGSGCIVPKNYTVNPIRLPDENLAPEIRTLKKLEDAFYTVPNMQCPNNTRYALEPDDFPEDKYVLHYNGTLTTELQTFGPKQYCIGSSGIDQNIIIAICFDEEAADSVQMPVPMLYPIGMMASIPFLLATVIVYAIIPELRNLYGKTLMCYVSSLVTAYILLTVAQFDPAGDMPLVICILTAFTIHFSFLASFFWLNVMCFDIWWTFGGFRSLQGSIKQRERKKFLMYSIYAWGCAILLTAVCVIMDFVPGIPEDVLRPEFGSERCWFRTEKAKALYFYGPMGVTVFCNIILFISTAAKIIRHKKDTAHHLKGTDSKRHDDNKQWFNLYLKLFIVMGINWSMEIISWLCQGPKYLWYLTDIANTLQGVIIFIIFVWKDKIKRLLIKRFDCKGPKFLSRDSTRSTAYHSSTSRTCTTSIPLHEKTNSFPDPVSRIKPASDDSDGV